MPSLVQPILPTCRIACAFEVPCVAPGPPVGPLKALLALFGCSSPSPPSANPLWVSPWVLRSPPSLCYRDRGAKQATAAGRFTNYRRESEKYGLECRNGLPRIGGSDEASRDVSFRWVRRGKRPCGRRRRLRARGLQMPEHVQYRQQGAQPPVQPPVQPPTRGGESPRVYKTWLLQRRNKGISAGEADGDDSRAADACI